MGCLEFRDWSHHFECNQEFLFFCFQFFSRTQLFFWNIKTLHEIYSNCIRIQSAPLHTSNLCGDILTLLRPCTPATPARQQTSCSLTALCAKIPPFSKNPLFATWFLFFRRFFFIDGASRWIPYQVSNVVSAVLTTNFVFSSIFLGLLIKWGQT